MANSSTAPSSVNASGDIYKAELTAGREGINSDPVKCAIVLGTLTAENTREYRVGRFEDRDQLQSGLCITISSGAKPPPLQLRHSVARNCFAGSQIYPNRAKAVQAADELYPNHHGIKVMHLACAFPSL